MGCCGVRSGGSGQAGQKFCSCHHWTVLPSLHTTTVGSGVHPWKLSQGQAQRQGCCCRCCHAWCSWFLVQRLGPGKRSIIFEDVACWPLCEQVYTVLVCRIWVNMGFPALNFSLFMRSRAGHRFLFEKVIPRHEWTHRAVLFLWTNASPLACFSVPPCRKVIGHSAVTKVL